MSGSLAVSDENPEPQSEILREASQAAEMSGAFGRSMRILQLVEHAQPATLRALLLLLEKDRDMQEIVAIRWAEIDPQGMAAFVDSGTFVANEEVEHALFSTWGASDPDVAWNYVAEHEGNWETCDRGYAILQDLLDRDPKAAMRLLTRNPNLIHTEDSNDWAQGDLAGAVKMVVALPDGFFKNCLSSLIWDWTESDPGAVVAWLSEPGNPENMEEHISDVSQALTKKDMALAEEVFQESDSPRVRKVLGTEIASQIAESDPLKAIDWIERELADDEADQALASIADTVASSDSSLAIAIYDKLPRGAGHDFIARAIAGSLWKKDPDTALQWASSLDDPGEQGAAADGLDFGVYYQQSPQATIELLSEHPDNAVLGMIAERFARDYQGADAMKWAQQLPSTHGERLTRKVFENWANSSPQTAADFLRTGAVPGTLRPAAVSALAHQWFTVAPDAAANWASEALAASPDPAADRLAIVRAARLALPPAEASRVSELLR
ncbi:MAG: hypothetical protein R3F19_01660 [Verrucomicrobiales bacterium]